MLGWLLGNKKRLNDPTYFDANWKPHELSSTRRLGSGEEAYQTLNELELLAHPGYTLRKRLVRPHSFLECASADLHVHIFNLLKLFSPDSKVVGDPKDVHFIIPPRNLIGYAIYDNNEYRMELFEDRYKILYVLRKNGKITATKTVNILRHESYGGSHAM